MLAINYRSFYSKNEVLSKRESRIENQESGIGNQELIFLEVF